jgi:uncharacterized iron-regulated protein
MTPGKHRPGPAALASLLVLTLLAAGSVTAGCPKPGEWYDTSGQRLSTGELFADLATAQVVLLGESHDRMEHHRWQLHTLAGLHARRPDMVIGLEMLPRQAQPALDAWVAGELDEQAFLSESGWAQAWGFDAALYLPILHFARMHKVPMVAINLDRPLVARLSAEGWDAVPPGERYQITPPAAPNPAYREYLDAVFAEHPTGAPEGADLDRFVAGQLIWDRAMAAGLAEAANGGTLAVGLMGAGHLEYGHGVPHQLRDLGIREQRILLPRAVTAECSPPPEGLADALFAIADSDVHEPPKPLLLGVRIDADPAGVRIRSVMPESVAGTAGLQAEDIVTNAAGREVRVPGDLVAIVRRQQPGNVLPLVVLREGEDMEILARFPLEASGD